MKLKRYITALLLIAGMVFSAEWAGEKEIVFPEIAALAVGLWVVDKQVWRVGRWQSVFLMTVGATVGMCIARYSPFPLMADIMLAFVFAAGCLMAFRTTLVPMISACMLPVLLGAESWVYPLAVLTMTVLLVFGQIVMERFGWRHRVVYTPAERAWRPEVRKWSILSIVLSVLIAVPVWSGYTYCILPPLIVTFVEFSNPKAGFRHAPVLVFSLLAVGAVLGSVLLSVLHGQLGVPKGVVAGLICAALFAVSEWRGRLFAPAGAVALIPLIIPKEDLLWFPLQASAGAALFIVVSMALFQRDVVWHEPRRLKCAAVRAIRAMTRIVRPV